MEWQGDDKGDGEAMEGRQNGAVDSKEKCEDKIGAALKELLETKHLYQYVRVLLRQTVAEIVPENSEYSPLLRRKAFELIDRRWYTIKSTHDPKLPPPGIPESGAHLIFKAPKVRLFCSKCKQVEPHDCTSTYNNGSSFFLVYECLSDCGGGRITFLVEREQYTGFDNLRLSGRNPIEQRATPPSIPLFLAKYHSESMIAFSCGFTRMAIFGLRTLIEQWARTVMGISDKIDGTELFAQYSALLPAVFSSMYPSLGALYSDLSGDMHGAIGDQNLFERAQKEIDSHFGALRSLQNLDPAISSALARKK